MDLPVAVDMVVGAVAVAIVVAAADMAAEAGGSQTGVRSQESELRRKRRVF